jgi:long-chain acyl-CoA synthetase
VSTGKGAEVDYNLPEYKVDQNDCLTFSYTSGTTGPPKGAMISHRNFTSFIAATQANVDARFTSEDVGLSYLPLPHILEREFVLSMFYAGAKIVYFGGDVQKLKDDLAVVKPTVFVSVPRLFSRFYEAMKAKMDAATGISKTLLDYALSVKL